MACHVPNSSTSGKIDRLFLINSYVKKRLHINNLFFLTKKFVDRGFNLFNFKDKPTSLSARVPVPRSTVDAEVFYSCLDIEGKVWNKNISLM